MSAGAAVVTVGQAAVLVALAALLVGVMRQVRARLEGRTGAGVLQPWRDLRKLLGKEPLTADGVSWISVAGPLVLVTSSLLLCALTPVLGTATLDLIFALAQTPSARG